MRTSSVWIVVVTLAFSAAAGAKRARFDGPHPVSTEAGGGMCWLEVPHSHSYEPADRDVLYVQDRGRAVFIGDPTAFDDDAPRHAYYNHHPTHHNHNNN